MKPFTAWMVIDKDGEGYMCSLDLNPALARLTFAKLFPMRARKFDELGHRVVEVLISEAPTNHP